MNDFTKLMIATGQGNVQKYSVAEGNEAIRAKFFEVLEIEEGTKGKKLRKAIRRHKLDIYEIIEETISSLLVTGWSESVFFQTLVEERNLDDGDQNSFYAVDDSVLNVALFSGNHHDLDRVKLNMGKSFTVPTSWYGVKTYEEFERFMADRIDWSTYVQKLYSSLDNKVNDMLYSTFATLNSTTAQYVASGDLSTATDILELAEKVQAATRKPVMIVGTKTALSKLDALSAGWASDSMKNQKNLDGIIGKFMGYDTMAIAQSMRSDGSMAYSNDQIYIIPMTEDKPIKFVNEGDIQYKEINDGTTNMDATIEAELQLKMGFAWVFGTSYGVYSIS